MFREEGQESDRMTVVTTDVTTQGEETEQQVASSSPGTSEPRSGMMGSGKVFWSFSLAAD